MSLNDIPNFRNTKISFLHNKLYSLLESENDLNIIYEKKNTEIFLTFALSQEKDILSPNECEKALTTKYWEVRFLFLMSQCANKLTPFHLIFNLLFFSFSVFYIDLHKENLLRHLLCSVNRAEYLESQ